MDPGKLNWLSASDAARAVRDGAISCEQLVEACLARIREVAWRDPWEAVPEPASAGLVRELRAELGAAHVLAGRPAAAIARRRDRDDVLFLVREPTQLAVVHLTWTGRPDSAPEWPGTELFSSVEEFLGRCADD